MQLGYTCYWGDGLPLKVDPKLGADPEELSAWTIDFIPPFFFFLHGSLNVPIEHHPTIRYMVYNGYYKVMFNIPKMGQLPTPVLPNI